MLVNDTLKNVYLWHFVLAMPAFSLQTLPYHQNA